MYSEYHTKYHTPHMEKKLHNPFEKRLTNLKASLNTAESPAYLFFVFPSWY